MEGLGFEGVLTVFDETPRMFRSLGRNPLRTPDKPHVYRYATGSFRVTIEAVYKGGRFLVDSIQYSDDPGRTLSTSRGIRLGDPLERLVDEYGNPDSSDANRYVYRRIGISFAFDGAKRVVAMSVFRPDETNTQAGDKPGEVSGKNESVVSRPQPTDSLQTALQQLGVQLKMGAEWRLLGRASRMDLTAMGWDGRVMLRIVRCRRCGPLVSKTRQVLERLAGPNVLAPSHQSMDRDALLRVGAQVGLLGVHSRLFGQRTAWLMALKRQQEWMLVLMTAVGGERLSTDAQRGIVEVLKGIQWTP